jgi:hypothetical protein
MWAQLALEIVSVVFWLSAFGSLAALAAVWSIGQDFYDDYGYGTYDAQANATKAAAALGAFEWLSFVVTLIFFGISLHRHRTANRDGGAPPPAFQEHKVDSIPMQNAQAPVENRYQEQSLA